MPNAFPTYNALFDETKAMTGQNAMLFVGEQALGHVNTFDIRQSFKTIKYTPAGSGLEKSIPSGHSYSVTLKETIIADMDLWAAWVGQTMLNYTDPQSGQGVGTQLNAAVNRPDRPFIMPISLRGEVTDGLGNSTSIYLARCVPDGDVSIFGAQPEQLLEREWTLAVNEEPQLQSLWQQYAL